MPALARQIGIPVLCCIALVYSMAHLYKTGVVFALKQGGGDFLANFPAPTVAVWAGRLETFFKGSQSEQWMPPPRWGYGPIFHLVSYPLFWLPSLDAA